MNNDTIINSNINIQGFPNYNSGKVDVKGSLSNNGKYLAVSYLEYGQTSFGIRTYEITNDSTWLQREDNLYLPNENTNGFGYSLSIDNTGNTLLVGGEIPRLFKRNQNQWDLQDNIFQTTDDSSFVAMTPDAGRIVVSGGSTTLSGDGEIYIYKKSNNTWTIEKTFSGYSGHVDINEDGTTIIVGDRYNENSKGCVVVFKCINENWELFGKITGGYDNQQFGYRVAISGNGETIVTSSRHRHEDILNTISDGNGFVSHSNVGTNRNANHLYQLVNVYTTNDFNSGQGNDNLSWSNGDFCLKNDGENYLFYNHDVEDGFGNDIDINRNGDKIIVGAHKHPTNFDENQKGKVGRCYVFILQNNTWLPHGNYIENIASPVSNNNVHWGKHVSMDGTGDLISCGSYAFRQTFHPIANYTFKSGMWNQNVTLQDVENLNLNLPPIETIIIKSGGGSGDPYITTLCGNKFKLPNAIKIYRMVDCNIDGKDLIINASVGPLSNDEINYLEKISLLYTDQTPITNGYFFECFYISYGDKYAIFDRYINMIETNINAEDNNDISIVYENIEKPFFCPIQGDSTSKDVVITVNNTITRLKKINHPQVINGIDFNFTGNISRVTGILNTYLHPKNYVIKKLKSTKQLKIKYTNKRYQKNVTEKWITIA